MDKIIIGNYSVNYNNIFVRGTNNKIVDIFVFYYDNRYYYDKRLALIKSNLHGSSANIYSFSLDSLFANSFTSDCKNSMCYNYVYVDAILACLSFFDKKNNYTIYMCPKYDKLISILKKRIKSSVNIYLL